MQTFYAKFINILREIFYVPKKEGATAENGSQTQGVDYMWKLITKSKLSVQVPACKRLTILCKFFPYFFHLASAMLLWPSRVGIYLLFLGVGGALLSIHDQIKCKNVTLPFSCLLGSSPDNWVHAIFLFLTRWCHFCIH